MRCNFDLHFSDVRPTTALLTETLSRSPLATSRSAADLFLFLVRRSFHPPDGALALVVRHLARRRDFPAVRSLLQEFPSALRPATLEAYLVHLGRARRATNALKVFDELSLRRGYRQDDLRPFHMYFEGSTRWLCCSGSGTGAAHSPLGFTTNDSGVGSH